MVLQKTMLYQVYPLGLCGALTAPRDHQPRILRLLEWIPHWEHLGITAIYFSPVFQSDYHGYDTQNYECIDPRLGKEDDFKLLCQRLHEAGIKVVLDGVFHHVGRGFWAFQDVLQNRENSPYKDWFHISFEGDTPYGDGLWYEPWEGYYELVKLNLHNEAVVQHLLGAIRSWKEHYDIDGLRLDVAYSLEPEMLRRLRQETGLTLIGELLFGDYSLRVNEGMLHSCTNYENYKSLYSAFNSHNLYELSYSLNRQFGYEPWTLYKGLPLVTFGDNHDVSRLASILQEKELLPLAYGMLYTMPGVPCLYYGSEWGQEGRKEEGDAVLRPEIALPQWNKLTDWIQKLIQIRKDHSALTQGGYRNLREGNQELIFERVDAQERIVVALNIEAVDKRIELNLNGEGIELLTQRKQELVGGLTLPAQSIQIIVMR